MMCEIHFEKGSKGNFHSHKHLQITYVAKGSFEFTIGDETKIVNQGDSEYMPSGVTPGSQLVAVTSLLNVNIYNTSFLYYDVRDSF